MIYKYCRRYVLSKSLCMETGSRKLPISGIVTVKNLERLTKHRVKYPCNGGIELSNPSHYPQVRMHTAIWSLDKILGPFFMLLQRAFVCLSDRLPIIGNIRHWKSAMMTHFSIFSSVVENEKNVRIWPPNLISYTR